MKPSSENEEAIFAAALLCGSPSARAAYLDQACAGRPDLRRSVEELLRASDEVGTLLDHSPLAPGGSLPGTDGVPPVLSPPLSLPPDEGPGTQIGRYKLLERIGEGGFGEVYVAEQREPVKRKVALKIIKLGMDTRQVIARFEAERQALAMMDHPNIAKVLDAGATDTGRPYFVMELVRGHAITRYCDENQLTAVERLKLFILVCQAIQHAHQKGIIHRDIKPSNILVTLHDGVPVPKVIDFGIAKATQGELTDKTIHTQFQQFIGTPAYVSPEQAEMSGLDIDTRSDIYALGVLLYELLVGRTPFDGRELLQAGLDSMRQTIREQEPIRPSTRLSTLEGAERTSVAKRRGGADVAKLATSLRGDVDWIVMKCLEKDRTRRYETASGLAADISRHLSNEPVVARPASAAYRFQKAWRRNKLVFTAATASVAALVAGLAVSVWQYAGKSRAEKEQTLLRLRAEANERLAREAQAEESRQHQAAVEAREQVELSLYAADMATGAQAVADGDLGLARRFLTAHYPVPNSRDLRGFEWRHLWADSREDEPSLSIRNGSHGVRNLGFSPDGRMLSAGSNIWSINSGKVLFTLPVGYVALSFVDNGDLLIASLTELKRWNPVTGLGSTLSRDEHVDVATVSPDRSLVATGSRERGLKLWNTKSWDLVAEAKTAQYFFDGRGLAFSPDGARLLTATGSSLSRQSKLELWSVPDLRSLASPVAAVDDTVMVAFSKDGKSFYTGAWNGTLRTWNSASFLEEESLLRVRHHRSWISGIATLPDGRMVTTAADRVIRIVDPINKEPGMGLYGHSQEIWAMALSPDGRSFATIDVAGVINVWPVDAEHHVRALETLSEGGSRMQIVGLSGDGQLLVTLTSLGLKFWNLRSTRVEEVRSLRWEYAPRDLPLDSLFNAGASAVSSDLKQFAVVRPDYSVELWDIRGRIMRSLEPSGPRRFLRFSPDGKRLVTTTSERSAALWNVESGERIANIPTETSFSSMDELPFEFSADGRTLAVGTVRQILLWDTHSRAAIRTIQFATTYLSFAVSPDSRWLAVGESDGNQVGLYDIATGKPSSPSLKGHVAGINVVQFSPDGQTLFSGGDDSEMRLWHVPTRRPVLTRRHRSNVISGMFSNDGSSLVTADIGQSVHIWRAPSWEVIAAAEAKVPAEDRKP